MSDELKVEDVESGIEIEDIDEETTEDYFIPLLQNNYSSGSYWGQTGIYKSREEALTQAKMAMHYCTYIKILKVSLPVLTDKDSKDLRQRLTALDDPTRS